MASSVNGPTRSDLDPELVSDIIKRTSGRSRVLVEHILDHGYITTVMLASLGYDHPPRAAADVRDRGIPLQTVVETVDGKRIGHYRFPDNLELDRDASGRIAVPIKFQREVLKHYGVIDIFTGVAWDSGQLQIDHRVPFRISGDPKKPFDIADFMPVSPAMNRVKSWVCEACPNWNEKSLATCNSCYWAGPDRSYEHVATIPERRLDLVWQAHEVQEFERLLEHSSDRGITVAFLAKQLIAEKLAHLSPLDDSGSGAG